MQKRGQVTIFIIIGFFLIGTVVLFLSLKSSFIEETLGTEKGEQVSFSAPVKNYIQNCIEQTGEEALIFIAEHGGYYELPALADLKFYLPYYFYEESGYQPSKEEVERQVSNYINNELLFCIRNFAAFEEKGYEIEYEGVHTEAIIRNKGVLLNVDFPVVIKQGEVTTTITSFSTEIAVTLGQMHEMIKEFLLTQREDPNQVCISCLTRLAIENDFRIKMSFVNKREMRFTIFDDQNTIAEGPYRYNFMNEYEFNPDILED